MMKQKNRLPQRSKKTEKRALHYLVYVTPFDTLLILSLLLIFSSCGILEYETKKSLTIDHRKSYSGAEHDPLQRGLASAPEITFTDSSIFVLLLVITKNNEMMKKNNTTSEMTERVEQPQDEVKRRKDNELLGAFIMFSIDIESNFKLYSYRVIPPEIFKERVDELINNLKQIR